MCHNIEPLRIDKEPLPEGWFLIEGRHLQATARAAKISFRLAQVEGRVQKSHPDTAGIIIQIIDRERMDEALRRAADRNRREIEAAARKQSKLAK